MDERLISLLEVYDELDSAIQRMITSLPHQMTEATGRLSTAHLKMRRELQSFAFNRPKDLAP